MSKRYPSGRLFTTWAAWEDYSAVGDFGDPDDTHYREGIYVGYRYFDSTGTAPLLPFGFGLGYTSFELAEPTVTIDGSRVIARVRVTNTGGRAGKEVVQVYVSVPPGRLDQPYQALAGFGKSAELAPGECQEVAVVNVSVLSKAIAFKCPAASKWIPPLINTPFFAAFPIAVTTATGVETTKAQGQPTTNTANP